MSDKLIIFPTNKELKKKYDPVFEKILDKDERDLIYVSLTYMFRNKSDSSFAIYEYTNDKQSTFTSLYETFKLITDLNINDPLKLTVEESSIIADCLLEFSRYLNSQNNDTFTNNRIRMLMLLYEDFTVTPLPSK